MGKAPLQHNKRNCYPPYPDHYLRAEPCKKLLLAKPTDGSWCDATLQSSIMYFIKFICLNIFWGLILGKQLTLFHSKTGTNSFCIYASLNKSSTQRPNVSQYVTICMSQCIIKCLFVNFQPLQKLFILSDVLGGSMDISKDFSSHTKLLATLTTVRGHLVAVLIKDSSELVVYTEFLWRPFPKKNNRNNLVITCEKFEYLKKKETVIQIFLAFFELQKLLGNICTFEHAVVIVSLIEQDLEFNVFNTQALIVQVRCFRNSFSLLSSTLLFAVMCDYS